MLYSSNVNPISSDKMPFSVFNIPKTCWSMRQSYNVTLRRPRVLSGSYISNVMVKYKPWCVLIYERIIVE